MCCSAHRFSELRPSKKKKDSPDTLSLLPKLQLLRVVSKISPKTFRTKRAYSRKVRSSFSCPSLPSRGIGLNKY